MEIVLYIVVTGVFLILVSDLIGNTLAFSNKFVNALVTSIVWGLLFVAIILLSDSAGYPLMTLDENENDFALFRQVAIGGAIFAFVADLIGNHLAFEKRIVNAVVTSIVWGVLAAAFTTYLLS